MEVRRRHVGPRLLACGAAHVGLARLSYHGFGVPPIVAPAHSHAMHETLAVGAVAAACVLGRAHRRHGNERAELRHGRACNAHHRANAGRSGRGCHAHVPRAPRLGACLLRGEGRPLAGCTSRATPPRTTQARAQPDGSFKLNGTKMWITNGAVNDTDTGDVFLVCARGLRRRPRDAEGLPRSAAALRRSRHPLPETAAQAYTHRALGAKRASRLHTRCTPPLPAPHHAFTTPAGRRYARTGGPEMKPSQAISLFMIERGMPGFSLGQRLKDK